MPIMKASPGGWRLLALLMLVYAVNFLDRQILGMALPGIRGEFHLTDSALGLLTGPAFALIYVLLGVPMAVLADRGHARAVIAGSLGFFSVMTLLCGAAGNFTQLLAARFGVGIGEAGSAPALNALIATRFPPEKRAGALSVLAAGANLGLLLAFFGGGLVVQHWGWRTAMVAAGLPGLVLMVLFLAVDRRPAATTVRAPLMETLRFLWRQTGFRLLALGSGLASIGGYASLAFIPSFLHRSWHLAPAQVGLLLAGAAGVIGFFGTMLPGLLSDRLRGDHKGLAVAALGVALWIPCHILFCVAGTLPLMIAALALAAFLVSSWLGPALAAAQNLAPDRMRAQTAALLLAALNLIGMAGGPLLVGVASDLLRPAFGEDSLRYALALAALPAFLAAWCFAAARRRTPDATT